MKKLTLPFAILLLAACNADHEIVNSTQDQSKIDQSVIRPIEGIEPSSVSYTVNAIRRDTILLANGGSILFEENSFVDEKGNPVRGEVDVEWQEFHSLADIAVSGIPMKYDSSGVQYDLISGGMFTIHASQGDKEVRLAPGKQATVNLVSLQDTPCYNFYQLDEKTGEWAYQTTKEGEKVETPKEQGGQKKQEEAQVLDMTVDTRGFDELNTQEIVGWVPAESLDPETSVWLTSNFASTRMLRGNADGTYQVEVRIKKRTEELRLKPYTLKDAQADTRKNELAFAQEMDEVKAYQQKLAQGKIIRSIQIADFGTYNWDIVCKRENSVKLFAHFEFPKKTNKKLVTLFLISPDENAIVAYDPTGDDKFSYDPGKRNCLIAIMPDNQLMVVNSTDFKKAGKFSKFGKPSCTYTFKDAGVKLRSAQDIENHLPKFI